MAGMRVKVKNSRGKGRWRVAAPGQSDRMTVVMPPFHHRPVVSVAPVIGAPNAGDVMDVMNVLDVLDSDRDASDMDRNMDMAIDSEPARHPLPSTTTSLPDRHISAVAPRTVLLGAWGGVLIAVVLGAAIGDAAQGGRRPHERQRAKPPAKDWDKTSKSAFLDDAFTTLEGERPDFVAASAARTAGPNGGTAAATGDNGGGFRWSGLISPDTLADEVKEQRKAVAAAVASASEFKGGGYDKAREAFSAIALAFGVIAVHDGDVRWKKDAANARDLFARVGFNCKVGTDGSFAEAKARAADLEALLDGGSPDKQADREEDFAWSQVAARPALMSRLEVAEQVAGGIVASKDDFEKQVDALLREVEIVAAIGEVIQQKAFEYHDDDTYRSYSAAMRDAAVKARDAVRRADYDAVRTAVGDLKKSCDTCHGDYRS